MVTMEKEIQVIYQQIFVMKLYRYSHYIIIAKSVRKEITEQILVAK